MAERVINHEMRERFGGTVTRAVLLRSDDEPGQLVVRVFVEAADDEGLAGWQRAHQAGIEEFRRELSLRLPSARLLEFTYNEPGAARIDVPDDGSLAAEQLSGREIVTKAMELLRANYVFPDEAERPLPRSRRGWRPASTTTWTRSRSPTGSPVTCRTSPGTSTCGCGWAADPARAANLRSARTARRCARWGGWTTSASAGSSG